MGTKMTSIEMENAAIIELVRAAREWREDPENISFEANLVRAIDALRALRTR